MGMVSPTLGKPSLASPAFVAASYFPAVRTSFEVTTTPTRKATAKPSIANLARSSNDSAPSAGGGADVDSLCVLEVTEVADPVECVTVVGVTL